MVNSYTFQQRQGFIDAIKRLASKIKKHSGKTQSEILDWIAVSFGFNNWSLFHKHIPISSTQHLAEMQVKFESLKSSVFNSMHDDDDIQDDTDDTWDGLDLNAAKQLMEDWVRSEFTPLIDFVYHDSESETGYGWPSIDITEVLMERFYGDYPEYLIEQVATELELNDGPWGDANF